MLLHLHLAMPVPSTPPAFTPLHAFHFTHAHEKSDASKQNKNAGTNRFFKKSTIKYLSNIGKVFFIKYLFTS
jgi:hypothetical protein